MADNLLSKIVLNGESYDVKDASARDRLTTLEGASKVSSFNGRNGDITPATGDYSYDMISDTPAINNATVTVTQNGTSKGSFTLNQAAAATIALTDTTYSAATQSATGLMSAADKLKLDKIASGAEVNTITGIKGSAESTYRTGNVNLTPENIGAIATSAKGIANGVVPLNASGIIDATYLPSYVDDVLEYSSKSKFPTAGETGKIYVDTSAEENNTYRWSGSTYILIAKNTNTTYEISKKGSTITLTGSDGSTTAITDSDTTYNTATTAIDGLMSSLDKDKLDGIAAGAQVNQNAFSNVIVGSTTIAADSTTDSIALAGSNVTLTPDATNDKITIGITKTNVTDALGYTPPTTNTTYSTGTTSAAGLTKLYTGTGTNTDGTMTQSAINTALSGKANSSHTHDDRYYTETEIDNKLANKIDNTSDGLNAAINKLSVGTSTPTDNDYYVCQYAGGGTSTTTYHRRALSSLWDWIKGKLATVATSGSYNDLTNKPTIPTVNNPTITITQKGTSKGTFTLNQTGNTTIALTDSDTTYSAATQTTEGLMSAADKTKLDGLAGTINVIFDENGIYFGDTTNTFGDSTCFIN